MSGPVLEAGRRILQLLLIVQKGLNYGRERRYNSVYGRELDLYKDSEEC